LQFIPPIVSILKLHRESLSVKTTVNIDYKHRFSGKTPNTSERMLIRFDFGVFKLNLYYATQIMAVFTGNPICIQFLLLNIIIYKINKLKESKIKDKYFYEKHLN